MAVRHARILVSAFGVSDTKAWRVAYALLREQREVAAVAVNDKHILAQALVQLLAAHGVFFYNLGVHIFGHYLHCSHGSVATSHHHDVLHVNVMLFTYYLTYIRNVVFRGHEVGQVEELQLVVAARYDGFVAPLDGHYMVGVVGPADVFERLVKYGARLSELNAQHDERSSVHIPALSDPRHLQSVDDIFGSQHLRIDDAVDAHLLEKLHVDGFCVFGIVYLGHRFACSQGVCHGAAVRLAVSSGVTAMKRSQSCTLASRRALGLVGDCSKASKS